MKRLTESVAQAVTEAINDLEILSLAREAVCWDVVPYVTEGQASVSWLVGVGLPASGTGDLILPFAVVSDPGDKQEIKRLVKTLYDLAAGHPAVLGTAAPEGSRLVVP